MLKKIETRFPRNYRSCLSITATSRNGRQTQQPFRAIKLFSPIEKKQIFRKYALSRNLKIVFTFSPFSNAAKNFLPQEI